MLENEEKKLREHITAHLKCFLFFSTRSTRFPVHEKNEEAPTEFLYSRRRFYSFFGFTDGAGSFVMKNWRSTNLRISSMKLSRKRKSANIALMRI